MAEVIWTTLRLAGLTTVLLLVLATPIAWWLAGRRAWWKEVVAAAAKAFLAFLKGPQALAVIKKYGYEIPGK